MSYKHITIGILGGIGPEATGNFYLKLISEIQKQKLIKSNVDYPRIIINSIPAPELTSKIKKDQLTAYIQGVKSLEKYGADFIVMACNTIHLYHNLIQKEVRVPILNLPDSVKEFILSKKLKSASVFGTPTTVAGGLYKFRGINYSNPNEKDLKQLSLTIENFNRGYKQKEQIDKVSKLANKYTRRTVDVIILGCTELSLMLADSKIPKIDTMDILVLATIKHLGVLAENIN